MVSFGAWDSERVFHDGDSYFSALLSEIGQARESVEFESYIFDDDAFGERVLETLKAAAARGVRVRLLVDGIGAPSFGAGKAERLTEEGVVTRVFHPVPWNLPFGQMRSALESLLRLNRRDHRKLCLVDGRIAYVGSLNVSANHLTEYKGASAWRDAGARVEGGDAMELQRAFDRTWLRARAFGAKPRGRLWTRLPRSPVSGLVLLNSTRSARRHHYRELVRRIAGARRRVWISNAYFAPDILLMRAMKIAAWSGADVRLLVPRKSDIFFMPYVTESYYSRLLGVGIRIHEYVPKFLHAKYLLIDDFAMLGSSNMNHRSLLHDLEADLVLKRPESLESLERQFQTDLASAEEVGLERWKNLSALRRMVGRVLLGFRYWF